MSIELKEGNWYLCFFYVYPGCNGLDGQKSDIMGCCLKEAPTDDPNVDWKITWRIRHYHDDKVWGSKDKKTWHSYSAPGTMPADEVATILRDFSEKTAQMNGNAKCDFFDVRSDHQAMTDLLTSQPWACRKVAPEGVEVPKSTGEVYDHMDAVRTAGTEGAESPLANEWMK